MDFRYLFQLFHSALNLSKFSINEYELISGKSDGIPIELFQILKDDAMKVLHSICRVLKFGRKRIPKENTDVGLGFLMGTKGWWTGPGCLFPLFPHQDKVVCHMLSVGHFLLYHWNWIGVDSWRHKTFCSVLHPWKYC